MFIILEDRKITNLNGQSISAAAFDVLERIKDETIIYPDKTVRGLVHIAEEAGLFYDYAFRKPLCDIEGAVLVVKHGNFDKEALAEVLAKVPGVREVKFTRPVYSRCTACHIEDCKLRLN